jgi:glycosyltransferase involved in cell wall biosynthesis
MRLIQVDDALGLERGSALVCIPVATADARTLASVRSVLRHSGVSTPVMLAGPSASLERIALELAAEIGERTVVGLTLAGDSQTQAVNAAIRAGCPSDLVLVLPGIRVVPYWLERLRNAALGDSTVASATPLSLGAGGLELFDGGGPGPDELEEAARHVAEQALELRPRIASIGPGCAYIRRAALELAGPLQESLALDRALAHLALRLCALGFVHVAADDVLVASDEMPTGGAGVAGSGEADSDEADAGEADSDEADAGEADSGEKSSLGQEQLAELLAEERVQETISSDEHGSLRRAVNIGRTTLRELSVTIDGRALVERVGGTQTYIIGLILALARGREVAVRVLVPPDLSRRAATALASAPDVELLTYEEALRSPPLTDVVHRPQQIFTPDDLTLLRLVGERTVIGQQDLIAYHNHSYHPDVDAWRAYRRTTRLALGGVDQVVFFSEHARRDALAEDLLPVERTHVVGIGVETFEPLEPSEDSQEPPDGLRIGDPFLLCIGADFAHKNRPFAIELLGALRELGWMGRLVLAGSHVPHGSSREHEQELLRRNPLLAEFLVDLGPVEELSRRWLYAHARALVYPTLYEGFGLLPVEAARADLPCLFAAQASLAELAGGAATLVPWDARASAAAVLPLLSDGPARASHLAELHALAVPSWDEVAHRLVGVYEQALAAPPSEAASHTWQELDRENYIITLDRDISELKRLAQEYQDAYHALEARVVTGLPLIDEGGLLTPAQQRGLMRVAARRRLASAALAPFDLLGRRRGGSGGDSSA